MRCIPVIITTGNGKKITQSAKSRALSVEKLWWSASTLITLCAMHSALCFLCDLHHLGRGSYTCFRSIAAYLIHIKSIPNFFIICLRLFKERPMSEPIRISPQEARQKVTARQALLVCAYDDADKFKTNRLEGALSFSELRSRLPGLAKDQEMIFYCA